jgi:uncharacterized protein (DUF1786 family)
VADETADEKPTLDELLEKGKQVLADAQATITTLDALNNTAVMPILTGEQPATTTGSDDAS